jgi:hypothetical protein
MNAPTERLWDRVARVRSCCDVEVKRVQGELDGAGPAVWSVVVKPRDGSAGPVKVEGETMLDALVEAMTAAATVCPNLRRGV